MLDKLSDFKLFKRIVEMGTLSAAAGELGLSPGSASLRLAAMERQLGTVLFRRTTRQMHLTPAGAEFFEIAERVLTELEDFDESLSKEKSGISGKLRVTAPVDLGRNYIAPAVAKFMDSFPDISVNLICTDRMIDLTERGIDLAVRYGALGDSSLRLRRISSNRRLPVAAPSYLEANGKPEQPADLRGHNSIILTSLGELNNNWTFYQNDKTIPIKVSGSYSTNDGEIARRWAIEGRGIALKSAWDVAEDINYGRLVPLLIPYCLPNFDLQLVFQPLLRQSARVRRLADYIMLDLRKLDKCLSNVELTPQYQNEM